MDWLLDTYCTLFHFQRHQRVRVISGREVLYYCPTCKRHLRGS